jgi:hypothetical protein
MTATVLNMLFQEDLVGFLNAVYQKSIYFEVITMKKLLI